MNWIDLQRVCAIAVEAGAAILKVYERPIAVEAKSDDSPLTAADRASHEIIEAGLSGLSTDIPILSEEGRAVPFEERRTWKRLWVVDPLDGTKEFIKKNGEFTVNIALVENGEPVLGVVFVPVQDLLFFAAKGRGAWRKEGDAEATEARVRVPDHEAGLTVVQSRSHPSPELAEYLAQFKVAERLSVGSSLKLCAVAEGKADLYPRLGPTMEWDTAAGQAIVECAGGTVTRTDGIPLSYNKQDLLNPHFIVKGGECDLGDVIETSTRYRS